MAILLSLRAMLPMTTKIWTNGVWVAMVTVGWCCFQLSRRNFNSIEEENCDSSASSIQAACTYNQDKHLVTNVRQRDQIWTCYVVRIFQRELQIHSKLGLVNILSKLFGTRLDHGNKISGFSDNIELQHAWLLLFAMNIIYSSSGYHSTVWPFLQ